MKSFEEASNSTRTTGKISSRMGTRSQAKHSGLKWEPSSNKEKGQDAKKQGERVDNKLDMSPISKAVVPKITVTSRQDPPITRELRKRTVQRSKVKSPICQLKVIRRREKVMLADTRGEKMPKGSNILEEDLASKAKGKTPRTRMEELVQQVFLFKHFRPRKPSHIMTIHWASIISFENLLHLFRARKKTQKS